MANNQPPPNATNAAVLMAEASPLKRPPPCQPERKRFPFAGRSKTGQGEENGSHFAS
jgi:hypothetical protein